MALKQAVNWLSLLESAAVDSSRPLVSTMNDKEDSADNDAMEASPTVLQLLDSAEGQSLGGREALHACIGQLSTLQGEAERGARRAVSLTDPRFSSPRAQPRT